MQKRRKIQEGKEQEKLTKVIKRNNEKGKEDGNSERK